MRIVTDYPKRQALLLAADRAGIRIHEVEELLWLIQACPTLERLPLALAGLSNALFAANRVWPGLLRGLGLDYLLPLCKRLIPLLANTALPATPRNAPGFQDWLSEGENMDRNPFYAALCELPVDLSPYNYRCWLLAAHVFLAQVALLRSASKPLTMKNKKQSGKQYFPTQANYETCDFVIPWDQIRVPARHAALALRDICGNARWQPRLLSSLRLRRTPKRFARSGAITVVAPHLSDKDRAWLQDRLDYIFNYLQQVYNVKSRHRGHGRKRQQQPPTAGANTVTSGAESDPAGGQRTRGRKKGSAGGSTVHPDQGIEDWDRFDICPSEDDEDDDYDSGDQGEDEYEYEDLNGDRDNEGDSDGDVDDDGTADRDSEIESGSDSDGETGSDNVDAESEGSTTNQNRVGGGRPRTGRETGDREHAGGSGDDSYQAIRASKGFAFAMDRLAPCELVPVDVVGRSQAHELLDNLLARYAANGVDLSSTPDFKRAETLVFLLASLWSGSSAVRICSMLAITNPYFDGVESLLCILDAPLKGLNTRFRVRVDFPKECAELQSRIGKDRSRTDWVELPDSADIGPLIWKLSVLKGKVNGNQTSTDQQAQPYRVFDRPLIDYTKEAKELLKPWNRTGRLSLTSIRNTLYGSILSWSGKDIVATTMITGVFKGSARVQMFYSSRRMEILQMIFANTVAALRHRILLESDYASSHQPGGSQKELNASLEGLRQLKPGLTFVPAPKDSLYVGSRRCPEDHEMQGAVTDLIHDLDKPWDLTEEVQFINYTNLYTFYAIWYFGFVTGCRPIATPFLGLAEVSPITLMAALCDKSDTKMRPVWITDGLFKHMQYYSKYVEQTSLYFSTAKSCWFLTQNRLLGEFQKHLIESFVQKYLPGFPANISRRYMMNALWDSGCPPELVRAWAGHASAGNAFWARGATAHYGEIGSALRQYIEPILNYLGFVPIAGKEL